MTSPPSDTGNAPAEPTFSQPAAAARRLRMRDFQTRLVDRMQAARSGTDVRAGQLGVLIGETRWLFDLQQAGEIVAVGAMTRVPLTQPWFLGLANIRGSLISVVDYAHFSGSAPTPIDKQCRIIAFAPALGFNAGLLVSRVLGLRNVADMQADLKSACYIDAERELWQVLDLAAITRNPRFLHVGAAMS